MENLQKKLFHKKLYPKKIGSIINYYMKIILLIKFLLRGNKMFIFKNKCKKQKPVRLEKKQEEFNFVEKFNENIKFIKCLLKEPEILVVLVFIIFFILAILFAMNEAVSFFVYNRGGI